jgi:hypothetical protein
MRMVNLFPEPPHCMRENLIMGKSKVMAEEEYEQWKS